MEIIAICLRCARDRALPIPDAVQRHSRRSINRLMRRASKVQIAPDSR